MDIVHLKSFVVLAKELHFHRAASRLFISQPGLTKRIRQLESELGVQLLRRHTRKVELTVSGSYLYQKAEIVIDQLDRIKSQLRIIEQGAEGEVRIGFVGSAMQKVIPDLVMRSQLKFPKISFSLEELSISRQIELLQKEQIDIGFVRLDDAPSDLHIQPIFEEPFSLVIPLDHKITADNFTGLHQLRDDQFILFSSEYSSSYYYQKIMSIFRDADFTPIVSHRSINANIIFKLVGSGFGVAIVPSSLAADFNLPIRLIRLENIRQHAILSIMWKKHDNAKAVENVLSLVDGLHF